MLPDVHRDRKDRQGRAAQDGHLDLFTELQSSETFSSMLLYVHKDRKDGWGR